MLECIILTLFLITQLFEGGTVRQTQPTKSVLFTSYKNSSECFDQCELHTRVFVLLTVHYK